MELKRVVVTGLGAITPLGKTMPETWQAVLNGKSGAATIERFDPEKYKTQFACEVKNYDPADYFEKKDSRKLDLFTQFALISAEEAILDSKLDLETLDKDEAGVIWGAGIGGIKTFQDEVINFCDGDKTPRFNPFFIPKMIADIAPGQISMKFGFRGPNFGTVSACASSTNAIAEAAMYIQLGKASVILSGGSEASICEAGIGGFNALQALSTRNDDPATASRPFCKHRDGFVMGEGGVCIVLEEYEHAKKRGAKIYAEFVGSGTSADAYHLTAPHPSGLGAKKVMQNALKDAKLNPEDIDYINVHGTSTPLGDIAETIAIKEVFGENAYDLNISSTKSMTGHLLGATGALEAAFIIMSTLEDIIPPTINCEERDSEIDPKLNLTIGKAEKRVVNYALSNTFGFGGHNASVIFKKYKA